jgi:hypothetical protein
MVIRVKDICEAADTASQGEALYAAVKNALRTDQQIVISFDGIEAATSSFTNASFVALLVDLSFAEIKRRLRIVDSSRQINDMIRRRLTREAKRSDRWPSSDDNGVSRFAAE